MKNLENTRAEQARKANRTLQALLKTPKTMSGLIAAVTGKKISKHFVTGWITEKQRTGVVILLKSGKHDTYQLAKTFYGEAPVAGQYPAWLEPRRLPDVVKRQAYISAIPAENYSEEDQE